MQILPMFGKSQFQIVDMKAETNKIILAMVISTFTAQCPNCQQWSQNIHSRYTRHLADLPWGGVPVQINLTVRRFRCSTPNCCHHYFTERVPEMAIPYRRRTNRFQEWLSSLSLAFGGEPTSRVSKRLGLWISGDSCLRFIRQSFTEPVVTPRVLGVDDWAKSKGRTYGTILCDLERRCVIELLPDREAKTLSSWLEAHPGIEIICRDRASAYTEAASQSAPAAQQVADRFHLLMNLTGAVKKTVERNRKCLRLPLTEPDSSIVASPGALLTPQNAVIGRIVASKSTVPSEVSNLSLPPTPRQQLIVERRARRRDKYNRVIELHKLGVPRRKIAQQLSISRPTVDRYLRIGHYPEHARRGETIRPFADYLIQRWQAGVHVAIQLFHEIKEQGYRGSYKAVTYFVTELKSGTVHWQPEIPHHEVIANSTQPVQPPKPKVKSVAPRHVAYLLTKPASTLTVEQRQEVDWFCQSFPDLATSYQLAQEFGKIIRERLPDQFTKWLEKALSSELAEFRNFAASLIRDKDAIIAALNTSWSSGQVEGHINRLKLIKREMFGRGKLDLLEKRLQYRAS
jgi:transposase